MFWTIYIILAASFGIYAGIQQKDRIHRWRLMNNMMVVTRPGWMKVLQDPLTVTVLNSMFFPITIFIFIYNKFITKCI